MMLWWCFDWFTRVVGNFHDPGRSRTRATYRASSRATDRATYSGTDRATDRVTHSVTNRAIDSATNRATRHVYLLEFVCFSWATWIRRPKGMDKKIGLVVIVMFVETSGNIFHATWSFNWGRVAKSTSEVRALCDRRQRKPSLKFLETYLKFFALRVTPPAQPQPEFN